MGVRSVGVRSRVFVGEGGPQDYESDDRGTRPGEPQGPLDSSSIGEAKRWSPFRLLHHQDKFEEERFPE